MALYPMPSTHSNLNDSAHVRIGTQLLGALLVALLFGPLVGLIFGFAFLAMPHLRKRGLAFLGMAVLASFIIIVLHMVLP